MTLPTDVASQALVVESLKLCKSYNARVALQDIDFELARGECLGVLGPNGAGKTTLLRLLQGLLLPTSGRLSVFGSPASSTSAIRRVGSMGEHGFYPFLSGLDNLRVLARRTGIEDAKVKKVLDRVGLLYRGRDRYEHYSLGMKQRLGLAAAILKAPDLLILDEPSNGLDIEGQRDVTALVREMLESGQTVILSSHNMDEVEALCGRVLVLVGGRLIAEGNPQAVRGNAVTLREAVLSLCLKGVQEQGRMGLGGLSSTSLTGSLPEDCRLDV